MWEVEEEVEANPKADGLSMMRPCLVVVPLYDDNGSLTRDRYNVSPCLMMTLCTHNSSNPYQIPYLHMQTRVPHEKVVTDISLRNRGIIVICTYF